MRTPDHLTELLVTEGLEAHLAKHGVTVEEVRQVLRNGFTVHRNKKVQRATFVLKGDTDGGRTLVIAASWADAPNDELLHVHSGRPANPTPRKGK